MRSLLRERLSPKRRQSLRRGMHRVRRPAWLGTLRRTTPLSDVWGLERGTPVDRYYIERFLESNRCDIRGRVLEVRDSGYTDRYGLDVVERLVVDIDAANPRATVIADLTAPDAIESDSIDCFVLTQTLQFIYETRAALRHARRILRPGGVLLATVPAVSRIAPRLLESDFWRFTEASCSCLFQETFPTEIVHVRSYGNVLTSIAFLAGIALEELETDELETHDPYFPVIIGIRAQKR